MEVITSKRKLLLGVGAAAGGAALLSGASNKSYAQVVNPGFVVKSYQDALAINPGTIEVGQCIKVTDEGVVGDFFVRSGAMDDSDSGIKLSNSAWSSANKYLARDFNGEVNVKWFGALGDGDSDDTLSLQAAFDAATKVVFPPGTYLISNTLTKDANSFKITGVAEGIKGARIRPNPNVVWGSEGEVPPLDSDGNYIFIKLGNGNISRYFNEVHHLTFANPKTSGRFCALYFDKVNNQSKIFNCEFDRLARGFEFANYSLANIVSFNKFYKCEDHFRLTNEAGNSTQITHNYFAGGRSYFNNSMTGVTFSHNTCDSHYTLYADGPSGLRGCVFSFNRFECESTPITMSFGVVRGVRVSHNYFQGQASCGIAIEIRNSNDNKSLINSATICNNYFEKFTEHYVTSNLPDYALTLYDNRVDPSLAAPTQPFVHARLFGSLALEGSWTPEVRDSSGNVAATSAVKGVYQLNNNFCTLICSINNIEPAGLIGGDRLRVYGLPFAASAEDGDPALYMSAVPRLQNITFSGTPVVAVQGSKNYATVLSINTGALDSDVLVSDVASGAELFFTITYKIEA